MTSFQRVAELGATAKRDHQVSMMTSQMRQQKPEVSQSVDQTGDGSSQGVFNPFSSNLNDEDDQRFKSPSQRSRDED